MQTAREIVLNSVNASNNQYKVIFTGSGTESNNLAINNLFQKSHVMGKPHVISSKLEHQAVQKVLKYLE